MSSRESAGGPLRILRGPSESGFEQQFVSSGMTPTAEVNRDKVKPALSGLFFMPNSLPGEGGGLQQF